MRRTLATLSFCKIWSALTKKTSWISNRFASEGSHHEGRSWRSRRRDSYLPSTCVTSQKILIEAQIALQFHKLVESDKPTKHLTLGFKLNWSFRRYMETKFCTCRAAEGDQKHSEGVDLLDHGVHLWWHREKTLPTLQPSTKHALWSALHLKFLSHNRRL